MNPAQEALLKRINEKISSSKDGTNTNEDWRMIKAYFHQGVLAGEIGDVRDTGLFYEDGFPIREGDVVEFHGETARRVIPLTECAICGAYIYDKHRLSFYHEAECPSCGVRIYVCDVPEQKQHTHSGRVCVECFEDLHESDRIPGHETIIECSKCGHPNGPHDICKSR